MYQLTFKTIWANFDPNRHMRHSAYADYAAEMRVRFFAEHQLSLEDFAKMHIGPILFKEEISYFKEIRMGEDITVSMALSAASPNLERWEFTHHIYNSKGALSATIKAYGAWIDLQKRKLTSLPPDIIKNLDDIPKTEDFKIIELKSKNK
jgi:acyl-CoA thioester hydrolase